MGFVGVQKKGEKKKEKNDKKMIKRRKGCMKGNMRGATITTFTAYINIARIIIN